MHSHDSPQAHFYALLHSPLASNRSTRPSFPGFPWSESCTVHSALFALSYSAHRTRQTRPKGTRRQHFRYREHRQPGQSIACMPNASGTPRTKKRAPQNHSDGTLQHSVPTSPSIHPNLHISIASLIPRDLLDPGAKNPPRLQFRPASQSAPNCIAALTRFSFWMPSDFSSLPPQSWSQCSPPSHHIDHNCRR